MERHVLGVTEVNQRIRALVEGEPMLGGLSVCGELSNYKIYPSGHHYFTLKDAESALRCVMFRGQAQSLRFRPENGMKVLIRGSVRVFLRDGVYQLYCDAMMPLGAGDLSVAFEQLKAKLHAEGLFDTGRKKALPPYPETIAVVTSPAGAAIHDMLRILRKRYPVAKVVLLPVRVQGAEAPEEIAQAIRYANQWAVGDLLIVGRGGGSVEDLWAFNDERVARAIYASNIPVISAVGHEPDVTISDFVADVRAATPSNAAELAVPDGEELQQRLDAVGRRLRQYQTGQLRILREKLNRLKNARVMTDQDSYVQSKRMETLYLQQRMQDVFEHILSGKKASFFTLAASLDAMSPLRVLKRGYAVVQKEDRSIVKDYREIHSGERLGVSLGRGGFFCTVEELYKEKENEWKESNI